MYGRTRYELFSLRSDVRFAVLDVIGIGWETIVEENDLGRYITRCSDYINNNDETNKA